jgi:hypothetical protein
MRFLKKWVKCEKTVFEETSTRKAEYFEEYIPRSKEPNVLVRVLVKFIKLKKYGSHSNKI